MNQRERLYYLDWIRIIVILLLVPFHSAITFTRYGDAFIRYPQHVLALDLFTWFLSIWIMPVLFFVSGISAYYALDRRTPSQYRAERRAKLLLPLVAGILLVCEPMAYLRALFIGSFHGGLFRFYPHFFQGTYPRGNFNWGHLWFLAYLFVFSLILLPLFTRMKDGPTRANTVRVSAILEKGLSLYAAAIPLLVTETLLRPLFPGRQNLVWDWANFILYLVLVFYGFLFAVNRGILDNIYRVRRFSLCLGALLFLAAVGLRISGALRLLAPVYPAYNCLMVFAWVFTVVGYARRFLNLKTRAYSYLNGASFPLYIFHFLPITIVAYFVAKAAMPVWLRYFLIVVVAYPSAFGLYECVRRIPYLRLLFGIRGPVISGDK